MATIEEFQAKYPVEDTRPDSVESFKKRYPEKDTGYTLEDAVTNNDNPIEYFKKKHPAKWLGTQLDVAVEGTKKLVGALLPDTAGGKELAAGAVEMSGAPSAARLAGKLDTATPLISSDKKGRGGVSRTTFDPDLVDTTMLAAPMIPGVAKAGLEIAAEAPLVGKAAQRGYIRGTMSEGGQSAEANAARFAARNEPHPGKQWMMGDNPEQRWFQGGDKKWRNEVSDASARELFSTNFDIPTMKAKLAKGDAITTTLGKVYDHPQLYKDYPELEGYKVIVNPKLEKNYNGSFDHGTKTIEISPKLLDNPKELKSLLVHETQHAVDGIEKVSSGAPLNWLKWKYGDVEGTKRYRRNAGEAAARSQENRMDMTPAQQDAAGVPYQNTYTRENYKDLDWSKDSTARVKLVAPSAMASVGGSTLAGAGVLGYNKRKPEGSSK